MGDSRRAGTVAVVALLVAAVSIVLLLNPFGEGSYRVRARFQDTGLVVKGGSVRIAGRVVGEVADVRLADDDSPEIELSLKPDVAPLREGTQASIRLPSLSSPAGRYIDLRIPSGTGGETIPDGGIIPVERTEGLVGVDQLFNMFDDRARKGLTRTIRGFGAGYDGTSQQLEAGYSYLDPALVGARRLFQEINRDTPALEAFLNNNAKLVTTLAGRREDLAALVDRLATATGAIAREADDLSEAVRQAPEFMRSANTTYVNLRSALDDLDPLVAATKRVAPRLDRVLGELQPFAREARIPVRSLADAVRRPGRDNDLFEVASLAPSLRDIAVRTMERNGAQRRGALPEAAEAFRGLTPQIAFLRPYTPDITGFFKALGQVGIYDANGQASRAAILPAAFAVGPAGLLAPVPQTLRQQQFDSIAKKQRDRCPGSMERPAADGSNPWRPPNISCDPSQIPPGS